MTLDDLNPQDTTLFLSTMPGIPIILERWSLYIRSWAMKRFTAQGLELILREQRVEEISELAFFMMKDKSIFKTHDDFMRAVVTIQDQLAVVTAMLGTIGIGEPKLEEIRTAMKKKEAESTAPKPLAPSQKKIGAKSSIRSQAATRGARRKPSSV